MTTLTIILSLIGILAVLKTIYSSKSGKMMTHFLLGLISMTAKPIVNIAIISFFTYLVFEWLK